MTEEKEIKRRRTKCKKCGELHYGFQPCSTEAVPLTEAQITQLPEAETTIEPIQMRDPWQAGDDTFIEALYRRIETLEGRVNKLIDALAKSKKVKGI